MGHNPSWEFLKMNEQAMTSPLNFNIFCHNLRHDGCQDDS